MAQNDLSLQRDVQTVMKNKGPGRTTLQTLFHQNLNFYNESIGGSHCLFGPPLIPSVTDFVDSDNRWCYVEARYV